MSGQRSSGALKLMMLGSAHGMLQGPQVQWVARDLRDRWVVLVLLEALERLALLVRWEAQEPQVQWVVLELRAQEPQEPLEPLDLLDLSVILAHKV